MRRLVSMVLIAVLFGTVFLGQCQDGPSQVDVDLTEAVANGQVGCSVVAERDLTHVVLHLRNLGTRALRIHILPGMVFAPADPGYQRMGVTETVVVVLSPREERKVRVATACLDMDCDEPEEGMPLTLIPGVVPVARLANSPTFQQASFRVRQFAIWTVLSRPASVDEYPGLGLGQEFVEALEEMGFPVEYLIYFFAVPDLVYDFPEEDVEMLAFVFTSAGIPAESADDFYRLFSSGGPTKGELAQVRQILEEAGFPNEDYPVLVMG